MVTKKSDIKDKKNVKYSVWDKEKKYPKDPKYHPLDPRNRPVDEGLEKYLSKHYKEKIDDGYLDCCQEYYKSLKKDKDKKSNKKIKGGQNNKKTALS